MRYPQAKIIDHLLLPKCPMKTIIHSRAKTLYKVLNSLNVLISHLCIKHTAARSLYII